MLVYSDDKAGRDAGELCGIEPIGVTATKDRDEILALDADCVVYMAQGEMNPMGAIDDICPLLASGKNVVSTALTALIYPPSLGARGGRPHRAGVRRGRHDVPRHRHRAGLGLGGAAAHDVGLFRSVDSLRVQELLDYSSTRAATCSSTSWASVSPPDADVLGADPTILGGTFRAPLMLLAEGLGATIEDFTYDRQVALAERAFDVAAGRIEPGTVAAMRFSATAVVEGRPALTVEHITRLAPDVAPDWPSGRGWKVTVEGVPSMVLEAKIAVHGEDENDQGCLGTAMHAVHAVVPRLRRRRPASPRSSTCRRSWAGARSTSGAGPRRDGYCPAPRRFGSIGASEQEGGHRAQDGARAAAREAAADRRRAPPADRLGRALRG